jgi:hypothetical protein
VAAQIKVDRDLERRLRRLEPIGEDLAGHAREIARKAKRLAAGAAFESGAYERSIDVDHGLVGWTVLARVNAGTEHDAFYAGLIEYGTEDTPPRAILRRAAEAAGIPIGEER